MSDSGFIHLRVHSAYSLAEGAITVKNLVKICTKADMPAVAVTDTNNLFGAMEFATEAAKSGIQPIIGAQVDTIEGCNLVLLAQTESGYRNLCALISEAYMHGDPQKKFNVTYDILEKYNDGLICLSGGARGAAVQFLFHGQDDKAEEDILALKNIFGDRFYIELQRHELEIEQATEERLIDLAYKHDVPLVATNDCYFADAGGYEAHDALLCIAEGRYITEENRRKETPDHYFKSADEMAELFADIPEAIENTVVIARRCSFLLQPVDIILPAFPTEAGRSEFEELKAQAEEGLKWRLDNVIPEPSPLIPLPEGRGKAREAHRERGIYFNRLSFELSVIEKMGFPGYFLIVSDFIRWAKAQNIPVGPGRGSGAGSVVAWALQITDLDPIEHNLLFERFLNPERISMPDFDIDFCQERRDEVIQYVQKKYGYDRVAQIITFGKLQARAVVRDVGRVLQIPYGQVDRLAKLIPNNPAAPVTLGEAIKADAALREERDKDDTSKKLIAIALQLEGLYRHASTHAAGLVIGDRALQELVPLYRDPRSTMPVTQFSMKYVEQAGLIKFDFLGLKTMTVIQKTVDMVNGGQCTVDGEENSLPSTDHRSPTTKINLLKIPLTDHAAYKLMASGASVGMFQLESAGMRDTLKKAKPNRFEDIVALVSLYRPGPMDNIPRYISVKDGKEPADYLHPKLQPVLEDTYGIMVYQEQVMQAAQILAGYTLGGADLLRRAMGKKIKSEMDAQRETFIKGAAEHSQVSRHEAEEIFDQIDKFAGYGFNKSHAAAYALIAYWTAWLKAHYPLEFMAASMTLDMGNTDKLAVFKQDLDRMGVKILPPDVNRSSVQFSVEYPPHPFSLRSDSLPPMGVGQGGVVERVGAIRYALAALKGVGAGAMEGIVKEREANGPFKSLDDFTSRIDSGLLNKRQVEQLAAAGAFECLNPNRAQIMASTEIILRHAQSLKAEKESGQVSLFGGAEEKNGLGLPALPDVPDFDPLEKLAREFASVGFYLSAHPLDSRRQQLEKLGILTMAEVEAELINKTIARFSMAGVLLKKQEKMSQKGNKFAFVQISDSTGIYEATLFSDVLAQTRNFLEPGQTLLLTIDAEQREDQIRYTVQDIKPLDKALEGKIREIQIYMDTPAAAPKIKQFLDIEGKGAAQVVLFMSIDDGRKAKIILPGRWNLGPQARNKIRAEQGVREILEA
jgi:DNA polymerase-3 subunit alpha